MNIIALFLWLQTQTMLPNNPIAKDYYQEDKVICDNNPQIGATSFLACKARSKVDEKQVKIWGEDKCFISLPISDELFARMKGKSYKNNCSVPRKDLRYLKVLHWNANGERLVGELVCHVDISADLLSIFRELYKVKYPIEQMVLIDEYNADDKRSMSANNTSCFNFRQIAGSNRLSYHSKGKAIDINPRYNPMVRTTKNGKRKVSPSNGSRYTNRSQRFPYKISKGDVCYCLFLQHGFRWGGNWKHSKDYQHFEK